MAGRKTKYNPEETPKFAEQYARDGLSDVQIAGNLGISLNTYYKWQNDYLEFSKAIKRGKAPVDFEVENKLHERAIGYTYDEEHIEYVDDGSGKPKIKQKKVIKKHVPPDVTAMIFWLKNRRPVQWSDKYKHEINKDIPIFPDVSEDDSDQ